MSVILSLYYIRPILYYITLHVKVKVKVWTLVIVLLT